MEETKKSEYVETWDEERYLDYLMVYQREALQRIRVFEPVNIVKTEPEKGEGE